MKSVVGRDYLGRATYHGIVRYFNEFGGSALQFAPSSPTNVRATTAAGGDMTVAWSAPPADAVNANRDINSGANGYAATGYNVYVSRNGYGFELLGSTTSTSFTVPAAALDGNAYYFRVAATNAGGESPASVVVGARKNGSGGGGGTNRILVVNGFDRNDSTLSPTVSASINYNPPSTGTASTYTRVWRQHINTFDYAVQAGEAIEAFAAGGVALGFDSAQNENVTNGQVNLANYQTVIWLSGEESTVHETFSTAEQNAVTSFLNGGGRLFVSGAEIGWDLDRATGPADADRSFYNSVLRADHAADDAGGYTASGAAGSIFDGISLSFDNGTTSYNTETPDRLNAANGSTVAMNYTGNGSGGAAIQYSAGPTGPRVVNMGFPFETITTASNRNLVMARVLTFFETPATSSVAPGTPDLVAASDTGSSSADNLTNRDNSSPGTTLQFLVSGTVAGAAVTVYADGVAIGGATATGTSTTVTTNGTADLADGVRAITARQTETGKSQSSASAALNVTIDTVAPTVDVVDVSPDPRPNGVDAVTVNFSQAVTGFNVTDLMLVRHNVPIAIGAAQAPETTDNLSFTVPNLLSLTSSSGNYWFAVDAPNAGITDLAGNALAATASDNWVHSLPSWLTPANAFVATWNSLTKALTVTGAATITADPGPADLPSVAVSGPSARLGILPGPTAAAVRLATLNVSNGGVAWLTAFGAAPQAANRHVLVVENAGGLSVTGAGSKLDLNDNAAVLRGTSLWTAQALVNAGFDGATWAGDGIISGVSAASPDGPTAVGYASGAQLGVTTFQGVADIAAGDVLLRHTYHGDTNLDGLVNTDDIINVLAAGKLDQDLPATWFEGDFTFDGRATTDDIIQLLAGGMLDE
jgi:hypothetical protein